MVDIRTTVIGSGVSGLTTGLVLAESGIPTRIVTRDLPEKTTSIVAAAVWYPYEAPPIDSVPRWGLRSLEVFAALAATPGTGVAPTTVTELFTHPIPPQRWSSAVNGFRLLTDGELPAGYVAGFCFETYRIDPPIYLPYLLDRFMRAGGSYEHRPGGVATLADVAAPETVVVNCTGLGAGTLVRDDTVYPIRGQVVAVENPGIVDSLIDESDPHRISYVFPRSNEVILGGTRQVGVDDLTPDAATTRRILADAARHVPGLAGQPVRAVRVGLRPGRDGVRVELEHTTHGPVVHNYGHAGNGYGLSWGCAEAAAKLVRAALGRPEGDVA